MTDKADPASLLLSLSPAFQISIAMKEHLYLDLSTRAALVKDLLSLSTDSPYHSIGEDWACERIAVKLDS